MEKAISILQVIRTTIQSFKMEPGFPNRYKNQYTVTLGQVNLDKIDSAASVLETMHFVQSVNIKKIPGGNQALVVKMNPGVDYQDANNREHQKH